jgi:hypothetical protein
MTEDRGLLPCADCGGLTERLPLSELYRQHLIIKKPILGLEEEDESDELVENQAVLAQAPEP